MYFFLKNENETICFLEEREWFDDSNNWKLGRRWLVEHGTKETDIYIVHIEKGNSKFFPEKDWGNNGF